MIKQTYSVLFFLIFFVPFHPIRNGLIKIVHNKEEQILEVTIRLFYTDLEYALSSYYKNKKTNLADITSDTKKKVFFYLNNHVNIHVNQTPRKLNFIGYEIEKESVWTYAFVKNIDTTITHLRVNATPLFDYYKSQTTLVHFKTDSFSETRRTSQNLLYTEFKVPFLD